MLVLLKIVIHFCLQLFQSAANNWSCVSYHMCEMFSLHSQPYTVIVGNYGELLTHQTKTIHISRYNQTFSTKILIHPLSLSIITIDHCHYIPLITIDHCHYIQLITIDHCNYIQLITIDHCHYYNWSPLIIATIYSWSPLIIATICNSSCTVFIWTIR